MNQTNQITDIRKSKAINSLSVVYNLGKVHLSWNIENQCRNSLFIIERTGNGELFEIIGILKGDSSQLKVTDDKPDSSLPYYRVTSTDCSEYNFSETKKIENFPSIALENQF
jgi:hypothetical protein